MTTFIEQTFSSYEEFEESFKLFKDQHFVAFRKKTSESFEKANERSNKANQHKITPCFVYNRVVFVCTHYGQPRFRGKGIKSQTKHTAAGCEAKFILKYDYYDKVLRIENSKMDHNHPTTAETYQQEYQMKRLTQSQREALKGILDLNPRNENLMKMINTKYKKAYTLKDVRALKNQLKSANEAEARHLSTEAVLARLSCLLKLCGSLEFQERIGVMESIVDAWETSKKCTVLVNGSGVLENVDGGGVAGDVGGGVAGDVGESVVGGNENDVNVRSSDDVVGSSDVNRNGGVPSGSGVVGGAGRSGVVVGGGVGFSDDDDAITFEDLKLLNVAVPTVGKRGRPKLLETRSTKGAKRVKFKPDSFCYICYQQEVPLGMDGRLMDWVKCSGCPRWFHNVCLDVVPADDVWVCQFCCH